MRVATIDIGTNTVLLLVADAAKAGPLQAVIERATITRLGEGVDRTRELSASAVERTTQCLTQYAAIVRQLGVDRVAVVGTSAMRDARGGEAITTNVRALFGVEARVISGEEEARLTFRGALNGLSGISEEAVVFDIGGGSTEIVVGRVRPPLELHLAKSLDVGSVRLTERHGADLDAVTRAAAAAFCELPPVPSGTVPVGIAGTMTTLAAVSMHLQPYDGARVHGAEMSRAELTTVVHDRSKMDLEARRNVPGMEPKRADVIVAGGLIALALLAHWDVERVRISDRGVRWGLAEELGT